MRKLFVFALAAFILTLSWATYSNAIVAPRPANYTDPLIEAHYGDYPAATPLVAIAPKVPVEGQTVTYGSYDGQSFTGYLARPQGQTGPLPALIVIHEWWGLNDNIKAMTDRLAGEGYTALAVDLYGGEVAEAPEKAAQLKQAAEDRPQILEVNLRQAYQYLEEQQQAPKIASIGWCFGGTMSFKTALLFPQELDASVIYYGSGIETYPALLEPLQMPILGIFGELDSNPPPEKAAEFQGVLTSLNKSAEIYIYEDANHAFANPSGTRYNAEAAEDAWEKTTAFLERHLKK
ncbi:MAG: dienelactone hydrolase family protein [Okeania sp. SIO2H7]|nr:dienelactone hydrolase family protein [Okeania sp. SIO2H7]